MISEVEKQMGLGMLAQAAPIYMRSGDACRLIGVTRQTLYQWRDKFGAADFFESARKGKLVVVDVPGLIRWARAHDRGPKDGGAWWQKP
jgi:hypothetical protein